MQRESIQPGGNAAPRPVLVAWAQVAGALVAGGLVGGAGLMGDVMGGAGRPGQVELWAMDRAAHAAFAIDSGGLVVERVAGAVNKDPRRASEFAPAAWHLGEWIDSMGDRYVAHAADDPGWDRARPGCWILVRAAEADSPPPAPGIGATILERWVRTGSPGAWTRAFRFSLPWPSLAIASSDAGVWVAAMRTCTLRLWTHSGRLEWERALVGGDGVEALCAASSAAGGGVWIAAGGAILRLDRRGARLPGQGGFAHLVGFTRQRPAGARISRSR